jgi:uncharacterized protein (UPF0248 family)
VKIQIHVSLTSVLNGVVCSNSRSDHLDHISDMRLSNGVSNEDSIPHHCCCELPGKERGCLRFAFDGPD